MEPTKLKENSEFRPKALSYVGKVMMVGGNLCVIIPRKIIDAIDIKYLDLLQVSVRSTGITQPVAGNRGKHLRKNAKKNNESE